MLCSRNALALVLSALIAVGLAGCTFYPGGRSCGVSTPVRDGQIVLVKKGNVLGAFVPRRQKMQPEGMAYDWYYRTDGSGTFRRGEPGSFKKGSGMLGRHDQSGRPFRGVEFGPFTIGWSGYTDGEGWLYYDHFDGDTVPADSLRICVTSETDIEKVDAANAKWLYKATPNDHGIRASKPRKNAKP